MNKMVILNQNACVQIEENIFFYIKMFSSTISTNNYLEKNVSAMHTILI